MAAHLDWSRSSKLPNQVNMFNSADPHAFVTQFLPKSHQISPTLYARRDYAPQTLPWSTEDRTLEPQQRRQSSIPEHWARERGGSPHLLRDGRRRHGEAGREGKPGGPDGGGRGGGGGGSPEEVDHEHEAEDGDDGERHEVLWRPRLRRRPRHGRAARLEEDRHLGRCNCEVYSNHSTMVAWWFLPDQGSCSSDTQ